MTRAATPGGYRPRRGDQQIIEVLLVGGTVDQAAEHAHVSRSTVYRRLRLPGFAAEVNRQQAEILVAVRRRTVALAAQALEALRSILIDQAAPAAARVAAARVILERADPQASRVDLLVATPTADGPSAVEQLRAQLDRIAARKAEMAAASAAGPRAAASTGTRVGEPGGNGTTTNGDHR